MQVQLQEKEEYLLIKYLTVNKDIMAKIKVTQVKSVIDRSKRQKATMEALGLRKINRSVVHEATPQILGMVAKVNHLVKVEQM